jgi:hypothetical protein
MSTRPTVFPSRPERTNYSKLRRQWSPEYNVLPNLPFLHLFDVKGLYEFDYRPFRPEGTPSVRPFTLDPIDFNRLKKPSIDYTVGTA